MQTVTFNRANLTIEIHLNDDDLYEVDLERAGNSAELLDWILQIRRKNWATPELLAALLDGIDSACREVFGKSAQALYCPDGRDQDLEWSTDPKIH